MDILTPQTEPQATEEIQSTEGLISGQTLMEYELKNYFELPHHQSDDSVTYIKHYLTERGINQRADILNFLRSIETRLGVSDTSSRRPYKVYEYLKVNSQIEGLMKTKSALENGI